ncbi:DUF4340 domain-containing protein [Trichothermofontia sichuanensis B231]|uniref:DUF4340 domain-containing protein n=1 Tax=Trichothermofontia sichuanensis TaxID=3045816 RepID=UPI002245CDD5|nr:DUF4340 domain-containing protein [Trichothermofontia sichuanensis]UZQ55841.1 DUF4340 domain-containing protein [Trichothermofontia sichuanensis B231]
MGYPAGFGDFTDRRLGGGDRGMVEAAMKLQRTTVIVLALAATLGGFVWFYEVQSKPYREEAQSKAKQIFQFKETDVQALTLRTATATLAFERVSPKAGNQPAAKASPETSPEVRPDASPQPAQAQHKTETSEASQWLMIQPERQPANAATIAFLLNLLATDSPSKTFKVPTSQLPEFGLEPPQATVEVTLANQRRHTLRLGTPDFNRSALYALVDPPATLPEQVEVALVTISFDAAVNRSQAEWLAESSPASDTNRGTPSPTSPSPTLPTTP